MSNNCPDFVAWQATKGNKSQSGKNKATVSEVVVDESDSDSEYPVPTITVETQIQDTPVKNFLIDCGATVNLVDSKLVQRRRLRGRGR